MIFPAAALLTLATYVSAYGYRLSGPDGPFPNKSENGQSGTNNCGTTDSPTSMCQTLFINSIQDFCLYAPPTYSVVGAAEQHMVTWCTAKGHGARLIPAGALTGVHYIETPNYVQITGTGDFTKMNIPRGDDGGELDPHGFDGNGNPIGALVVAKFGNTRQQALEWHQFISDDEFCIRLCKPGKDDVRYCEHIYDVMGCYWADPGNYASGSFDTCAADIVSQPPGVYVTNGRTSTWYQGVKPTPAAHAPAKSSNCVNARSPAGSAYGGGSLTTTTKAPTTTARSCANTAQCAGLSLPAGSHAYCGSGKCTFRCNKNFTYNSDRTGCVSTSSGGGGGTTVKSCSNTAQCAGQPLPPYGHAYCASGKCSFRCNKGYTFTADRKGCMRA